MFSISSLSLELLKTINSMVASLYVSYKGKCKLAPAFVLTIEGGTMHQHSDAQVRILH